MCGVLACVLLIVEVIDGDFYKSYFGLEFLVESCSTWYPIVGVWLGMEASSSHWDHSFRLVNATIDLGVQGLSRQNFTVELGWNVLGGCRPG